MIKSQSPCATCPHSLRDKDICFAEGCRKPQKWAMSLHDPKCAIEQPGALKVILGTMDNESGYGGNAVNTIGDWI